MKLFSIYIITFIINKKQHWLKFFLLDNETEPTKRKKLLKKENYSCLLETRCHLCSICLQKIN